MDPTSRALFMSSSSSTLGTSPSNPAISGIELRDVGQPTGWYWIQTSSMGSAQPVYVNNTDDGGGWMLVAYHHDHASGTVLGIPAPNTFTLSSIPGSFTNQRFVCDRHALWYHNGVAQCTSTMRIGSESVADAAPLLSMPGAIARRVVYSNPSAVQPINMNSLNSSPKLSGTWTPLQGYTSMTSAVAIDAPCDWVYNTNDYWTDCGPSTGLTTDGRSGNAQGTGSWTNTTSRALYGLNASAGYSDTSSSNSIRTFSQYIK